ncbi:hypothetical protein ACFQ6C_26045 [Streptomyces sp. NPDC056454]|uniref:hypothetical protein n=1 Tax=Streptomyces sp. NPDC056454 TaxID=3345823 RepID=UPI0036C88A67
MSAVPAPAAARTIAPIAVGAVLTFLATRWGIAVDEGTQEYLVLGLSGVLSAAYYVVVLALESRWPRLGILLGSTARPTYEGKHRKASFRPATATPGSPEDHQP